MNKRSDDMDFMTGKPLTAAEVKEILKKINKNKGGK